LDTVSRSAETGPRRRRIVVLCDTRDSSILIVDT